MIRNEYNKALEQYQEALNVSLSYLSSNHTDLAPVYDAIGKTYFNLSDYQNAIENFERAADLFGSNAQSCNDQFVSELNNRISNAKKLLNKKQ
jgi:tetratricopeptide (TPR) repeat protein